MRGKDAFASGESMNSICLGSNDSQGNMEGFKKGAMVSNKGRSGCPTD